LRYFVPDIRIAEEATNRPDVRFEKLGGGPWRMAQSRWPTCAQCKKSQSLLAQFSHDAECLDLGREGRGLFAFQCAHDPGMCDTWSASSGANACFVLEPEDLSGSQTSIPNDLPPQDNEVRIVGWHARDDGLPNSIASSFFDDQLFLDLADDILDHVTWSTRLGGVPHWIQNPSEGPGDGWRFIGQLDSTYSFLSPPTAVPDWVSVDEERFEGRSHYAIGPNFGDGGLAYFFLKSTRGVPAIKMLWQCG
jgi:hypothetical protein